MPLNAALDRSESAPLLGPDPRWRPLTAEELRDTAGGPGWRKARCSVMAVFWLGWAFLLAGAVALVVRSPRPEAAALTWWQEALFYRVRPDHLLEGAEESGNFTALCDQLPYLKGLSAGALILQGVFEDGHATFHFTPTDEVRTRVAQIQHLLKESSKMGLKVVLDVCDVEITGNADESSNGSTSRALHLWLEQGVAGFAICDTDAAYSEETLLEWRSILKEFSEEEERILVVKQTGEALSPLNATLLDVVIRSILPSSPKLLSVTEVGNAIRTHLQTWADDVWIGWTAGGKVPKDLKKLLLVLMMTLPGSPAVQYNEDIDQTQRVYVGSSSRGMNQTEKRSTVALLTSLSRSRSREEALLFGNFSFLPFNSSSNSTRASFPSTPVLAFLRSWGCVQFLVALNVGPEPHTLDPAWAQSLQPTGVFVASTEMDRVGSVALSDLRLRPHEAVVIKLLEARSYS